MEAFKCVRPIFPRAENVFFIEQPDGTLEYEEKTGWIKDDDLPGTTTGYVQASGGDAGGPYMIRHYMKRQGGVFPPGNVGSLEYTHILLAVHHSQTILPPTLFSTSAKDQCRMVASKISTSIMDWIKLKFFI